MKLTGWFLLFSLPGQCCSLHLRTWFSLPWQPTSPTLPLIQVLVWVLLPPPHVNEHSESVQPLQTEIICFDNSDGTPSPHRFLDMRSSSEPCVEIRKKNSCTPSHSLYTSFIRQIDLKFVWKLDQVFFLLILNEFKKFGDYFHQAANSSVIDAALVIFVCRTGVIVKDGLSDERASLGPKT